MQTYNASRYADNRDYYLEKSAAYYKRNRQRLLDYQFQRKYGATRAELLATYGKQCACCGTTEEPPNRGWHIDHDHTTGKIRGVLCIRCNTGIGKLGDSIEGLERALAYLQRTRKDHE